ncbi:MAG: GntR family transcriptional regulator [Geitlerinemataceae cyanobacterium]
MKFHIQSESDIPASNQLFNQIRLAIASRQFPPGHRLPSTRQLAMQTGLHRNTIGKVYRQLEEDGLVEAQAGSGIYVRALGHEGGTSMGAPLLRENPEQERIVKSSLDELLQQGCSLSKAREMFLGEIDWRLRCSARLLVTAPMQDIGAGELMKQELEESLNMPVQLVPMEELSETLDKAASGTVVTSRYFIGDAQEIAAPKSVRVIPIDIYDYAREMELVQSLPKDTCLGLVCLSAGILRAGEVIVHSLRGDEILVISTQLGNSYKLNAMVRSARHIICDQASYETVKEAINAAREEIIRAPQIMCFENYINQESIALLKRELGLA